MMASELLKRVVEECGWRAEGELGQGGGGASDVGAEDERGDLRPWG
jgi:hypothetical protein